MWPSGASLRLPIAASEQRPLSHAFHRAPPPGLATAEPEATVYPFCVPQISLSVYVTLLFLARRLVAWRGKPFDKELKGYVLGEHGPLFHILSHPATRLAGPELFLSSIGCPLDFSKQLSGDAARLVVDRAATEYYNSLEAPRALRRAIETDRQRLSPPCAQCTTPGCRSYRSFCSWECSTSSGDTGSCTRRRGFATCAACAMNALPSPPHRLLATAHGLAVWLAFPGPVDAVLRPGAAQVPGPADPLLVLLELSDEGSRADPPRQRGRLVRGSQTAWRPFFEPAAASAAAPRARNARSEIIIFSPGVSHLRLRGLRPPVDPDPRPLLLLS